MTLTNQSSVPLAGGGWELYFNLVRMLLPESCPREIVCTHAAGDLFSR